MNSSKHVLENITESFIDMDMINKRMKTNPYKFNVSNFCFDLRPFSNDLSKAIDYAFYNTYVYSIYIK